MTTETQTAAKKKPAFYIFTKDANGHSNRVGAAFLHDKGNGFNIVIGNARYAAFPPKAKFEDQVRELNALSTETSLAN